MSISQSLKIDDEYKSSKWTNLRYAIHEWRPCYGLVSRCLRMPRDEDVAGRDWLRATIEWDKTHRVRYRLWRIYVNGTQPISWFEDHTTRPLRSFWVRGRRGWTIEDTWSVDGWLDGILPQVLDELRKNNHGWPGEPMTFEEWNGDGGIIDQIADGFRAHRSLCNLDFVGDDHEIDREAETALTERYEHGMALFAKWYGHLWD